MKTQLFLNLLQVQNSKLDSEVVNIWKQKITVEQAVKAMQEYDDQFNPEAEQNKRMRIWFEEKTGLKDALLSEHMDKMDVLLSNNCKSELQLPDEQKITEAAHKFAPNHFWKYYIFKKGANYVMKKLKESK